MQSPSKESSRSRTGCAWSSASAQLAVLAAAAVVTAEGSRTGIIRLLAGQAQPHARNRLPAGLADRLPALGTLRQPRTPRQPAACALHGIFHRGVDLFVD